MAAEGGRDRQVRAAEQERAESQGAGLRATDCHRPSGPARRLTRPPERQHDADEHQRSDRHPVDRSRAPHLPNRLSIVFSMTVPFSDAHSDTPAALAPCSRIPSTLTGSRAAAAAISRRRNRRMPAPWRPAIPGPVRDRGKARQPREQKEREPAEHQRDRQVVKAANHAEGDLGDLAGLVAPDQPRDGELGRGPAWPRLNTRPP